MNKAGQNGNLIEAVPPQDIDAERALLGALMQAGNDDTIMADVIDLVKPKSFYKLTNEAIYSACLDLFNKEEAIDLVTVAGQLKSDGNLEKVGGVPALDEIIESCPSSANATYYAEIVRDMAMRRYLVVKGASISQMAFNYEIETNQVIEAAETAIMEVRAPDSQKHLIGIKEAMVATFNRVDTLYHNQEGIIGLRTGFPKLDQKLSGMQPGQYIVVGGRPGMGKSGFIQNIMYNVGVEDRHGIVLFNLETSAEAFTMRMLAQGSKLNFQDLRTGHIKDTDYPAITLAVGKISESKIKIDTTGSITPTKIRQNLRQAQRDMDIDLIVVDYLQLMSSDSRSDNRVDKVTNISSAIKGIAQDYGCPMIAVSQLSRKVEERPDKRPQLSDLRESGAIEQDADVVMFVYREGYYDTAVDPLKTEIIIAKHKDGPTGQQNFRFDMSTMTFEEAAC